MKEIIILGAGATSRDVIEIIKDINIIKYTYNIIGLLDDDQAKWEQVINGVKVLGPLEMAIDQKSTRFVHALGNPKNYWVTEKVISRLKIDNKEFESLVHPTARIFSSSSVGYGVVVYPNSVITSNVLVGNNVTIMANTVVNHDVKIGDFTIIASSVSISGNVQIGNSCYLGSGSSIMQNVIIGHNALVGMGSVVLSDVKPATIVAGNPALFKKLVYVK